MITFQRYLLTLLIEGHLVLLARRRWSRKNLFVFNYFTIGILKRSDPQRSHTTAIIISDWALLLWPKLSLKLFGMGHSTQALSQFWQVSHPVNLCLRFNLLKLLLLLLDHLAYRRLLFLRLELEVLCGYMVYWLWFMSLWVVVSALWLGQLPVESIPINFLELSHL